MAGLVILVWSCQSSDCAQVQELKFRINQDSILMASLHQETDEINDLLSQADHLNAFLSTQESISKHTAISKIQNMEDLLDLTFKKIDSLEEAIKNSSSSLRGNAFVKNSMSLKRDQVAFANDYYQQLELNIKMLTGQNINLAKALKERDLIIAERDQTIVDLSNERDTQQEELNDLASKVTVAEKNLKESEQQLKVQREQITKEKADFYYDTGVEMRDMFDETGTFGTRKTRKELINKAYFYLQKAQQLGHARARGIISELQSDRKYSKFID
ncbi:MAG TPA: hypothetical protein VFE50_07235 [Cyclobacteriaceae bacterium]|nr:hypothetical protein [Cyclobacteriaceae bacterium]